ncbi:MAG: transcription-repair coupling factor [Thermodesulfobacteriota bacterium]
MVRGRETVFPFEHWLDSELGQPWKSVGLTGLKGSSKAYLLALWREKRKGSFLVIVPHLEAAESLLEDFRFFQKERTMLALRFPPWETLPYDKIAPHPEIIRERVKCLFSLLRGEQVVLIAPIRAVMQKVLSPTDLETSTFSLSVGQEVDRDHLIRFLNKNGFTQVRVVEERGDFSIRGAIVDIYAPPHEEPLRLEFDGDRLESIRRFETESQRSLPQSSMPEALLLPARDMAGEDSHPCAATVFDYFKGKGVIFVEEGEEVEREGKAFSHLIQEHYERALSRGEFVPPPETTYLLYEELSPYLNQFQTVFLQAGPVAPPQCQHLFPVDMESNEDLQREIKAHLSTVGSSSERSPFSVLIGHLRDWQRKETRVVIVSHTPEQAERLREILGHYEVESHLEEAKTFQQVVTSDSKGLTLLIAPLSSGFQNMKEGWVLLTEEEIFGERRRLRGGRAKKPSLPISFSELREDNFVVHIDYGVGIYRGLKHLKIGGVSNDYLLLEYLDGDKLYVPVDRLNLIQRYVGADGRGPRLDKLGGTSWERAKKRAKAAVSAMVKEILDLYAARRAFQGHSFSPPDQFFREFEATFDYEETPDQIKAIEDVMQDMSQTKPMDRLICGDVGFGKTEVAIRAAYRAVMDGKQVAMLVPTTVLAQQHYQTFRERFKNYPVVIEMLSRFRSPPQQKEVLQRLQEGSVDIVIGTHRLLQRDVTFRDLGLVVIDEEHRFGVSHKERLKQLRKLVDVITLTATPIPRTLQMSISGIRDLSLIQTPPQNRLAIQTFVVRYDDELIRKAVIREFQRGGQVFFVHHRVQNIHAMAHRLKRLIPEASLAVAHGQMKERELEKVMLQFVRKEFNLLVCTSLIESGLDIPAANTILINHAEQFGLADLYQLRGRVGRGNHQAYAYLLIPGDLVLSRDAMRRLRAIQELSELGSGFRLAVQDLEIRGAGNLLGPSQSGHIAAVGFELYTQLLEKAVRELRGEEIVEEVTPEIHFHLPAFIPEDYVEDPGERLNHYRRLSLCRSDEEVKKLREELIDRFGKIPEEAERLLEVIKVKILLTKLSIKKFEETTSRIVLTFDEKTQVSPEKVVAFVHQGGGRHRLTPDAKLVVEGWPDVKKDPFGAARKLLQALS